MKLFDRGYWISKLFYYLSWPYFFFNAARFKSMTFFSACNPRISFGGMLDERKTEIYQLLPPHTVPQTAICTRNMDIHETISELGISFPIILKPNIGFKGFMVAKVRTAEDLTTYLKRAENREILLQEYVDYPKEFSLLYYRGPKSGRSGISSLIEKKYPYVRGDGVSNLKNLILDARNPFLKKDWIMEKMKSELTNIPPNGERVVIDDVGNYSRGAKFYSLNDEIDSDLLEATDRFFENIPGIDFCRIDFKAPSLEAYKKGEFKILEINGAKSEPLHIYDPSVSIFSVMKSIHLHWNILNHIVKERLALSYKLPTFRNGLKSYVSIKKLMKS